MLKKAFAAALCLALLAVMSVASSWATPTYSISTKINSLGTRLNQETGLYETVVGGVIKTRTLGPGGAEVVTHNRGIKYTTVLTTKQVEVEIDPADGYKIASLTKASYEVVGGVVRLGEYQPVAVADKYLHKEVFADSADPLLKGKTQFLQATFAVDTSTPVVSKVWQLQVQNNNNGGRITVSRGTDSNHYVTVGKPLVKNYIDTTPVTVTVDASNGYFIDYVIINGRKMLQSPATTRFADTVDATFGSRLRSYNVGYKKAPITVDTTNGAAGGISPLNPNADPLGSVRLIITPTGLKNKVTAVSTTGGTLTLTDRFGEPVTLPHVGPVKATITGITSAITVTASYGLDATLPGVVNCTSTCHSDLTLVAARPYVKGAGDQWLVSKHSKTPDYLVDCVRCHQTMPGPQLTAENNCKTCHKGINEPSVKVGNHVAGSDCIACHNPHSTVAKQNHAGGQFLAKAQFVAQGTTCADCHAGANTATMAQWAESGHGNVAADPWYYYDWAAGGSRLTCQRCHTATGFKNNATGVVAGTGMVAGKVAGVLNCSACHLDVAAGTVRDLSAQNTVDYDTTVANDTVTYANVGASNVCISCHAGMGANGNTIKNSTGDFNAKSALQPHYLAAAGVLMGRTGYEFAGVNYSDGYHKNIGVADFKGTGTSGPCVACHMTDAKNHTFEVSANATCAKCHLGITDATIEEEKFEYNAAVEELNIALKAKGIWFIPSYPYFVADNGCIPAADGSACTGYDAADAYNGTLSANEKNRANGFKKWDTAYPGKGKDTMGAAFNYNLLVHEPGAFIHNKNYAYQLIRSSIDFLIDGRVGNMLPPIIGPPTIPIYEPHMAVPLQENICSTCHAPGLPEPAGSIGAGMSSVHAVGEASATPSFRLNGDDLDVSIVAKIDGVSAVGYSVTRVYRYFDDSANGNGWVSWRYPTTPVSYNVTETAGTYTVKILGGAAKANDNSRYYVRLEKTGAAAPRIAAVGNFPASPVNDLVSNEACTNCHGNKIPVHAMNPLSFEVCVVCHGADKSTSNGGSTYSVSTYPRLGYLLHGVHASKKVMPSGEFVFKPGAEPFKVAYPTYMNNCSVCHADSADLATVTAKPVSYSYCMTCHENFTGFDHGNTVFGGQEHAGFTAATDCSTCHAGKTVNDYHNGLLTERSGVIWNGVDTSITEGARINTTINSVERQGGNLVIKWTATFNGNPVNPCGDASTAANPLPSWKVANNGFSVLRAYSEGDDWGNAGISTSPGQPASTNIDWTNVISLTKAGTTCSNNEATTTVVLTDAEKASTSSKIAIALQGKVNLYNPNTNAAQGVRAKTAYQAYNFQATDGVLTATARRDVTDTNSCLKCHPGSLYQHGGNRIDSMELCVMCHNETSTEQNVRLLDRVDATEAYDGKIGQTYGFKSLLHAIHSATVNEAITTIYRTNGNYVFTGKEGLPNNYPTGDIYADDAKYGADSAWFIADDDAAKTQEVGTGSLALVYGSSSPYGTGPKTEVVDGVQYRQLYRAHNVIRVTYPQDLKNCTACHKDGGYSIPNAAVATPTVVDAGTLGLGGTVLGQTASNPINSNIADDLVIGATTAACMSCHNANATLEPAKKAWLDGHASKVGVARGALAAESCATCHKP